MKCGLSRIHGSFSLFVLHSPLHFEISFVHLVTAFIVPVFDLKFHLAQCTVFPQFNLLRLQHSPPCFERIFDCPAHFSLFNLSLSSHLELQIGRAYVVSDIKFPTYQTPNIAINYILLDRLKTLRDPFRFLVLIRSWHPSSSSIASPA